MRLDRVEIKNFRSIKAQKVTFKHRCRVLVGINESGKSNVLRALSMLCSDVEPGKEDVREASSVEPPVSDSYVWFIFVLEDSEVKEVFDRVSAKILGKTKAQPLVTYNGKTYDLRGFCEERREGLFIADVMSEKKHASYWGLPDGYSVDPRWKKVSAAVLPTTPTSVLTLDNGSKVKLSDYSLVNLESFSELAPDLLEDLDVKEINKLVGQSIKAVVEENLPNCVYWTYSDQDLLPARISLTKFAANPDSCSPLRNMFQLAGIIDIQEAVSTAQQRSTSGMRNLLDRVAKVATKHIHTIWKEYGDVKISLEPYGPDNIDAHILDSHNRYEMSRRSDGFKRFVSFLLMISAQVRTDQLKNTLLLIDEPDTGLHPRGAEYLREELLTISNANYVVYSTHSIFMIDKENIGRHFITTKKQEITTLNEANESNVVDEEVLFNALGFSIFKVLQKSNLVFEGWRDKRLFDVALARPPAAYKHLKDRFEDIGRCFAHGVKDIRYVTPLLELANRDCFILSDDDEIARQRQKEYIESQGYGLWLRYSQIDEESGAVTGEDFISLEAFREGWRKVRGKHPDLPEISDKDLRGSKGRVCALGSFLSKNGFQSESKAIVEELKSEIFRELKSSHIDGSYYVLLDRLASRVLGGGKDVS